MTLPLIAIFAGLLLLLWSADRFVTGTVVASHHMGLPPLLIGMLVVGFGTSAPEMVVSVLAASQGNPNIALGNAYGSNITNIALILGLTALLRPIGVASSILRKELPLLMGITLLAAWQLLDGEISQADALVLLGLFGSLLLWSIWRSRHQPDDSFGQEVAQTLEEQRAGLGAAILQLVIGLVVLVVSSRALVWGAVSVAQQLGVSDLFIGLTIIAVGTSLPELASSLVAVRRGENDIALGNVLGSNLFNTLAVVGLAGVIQPMRVGPEVLQRDVLVMGLLTLALFVLGYRFRGGGGGRINRWEGGLLLLAWLAYTTWLLKTAL